MVINTQIAALRTCQERRKRRPCGIRRNQIKENVGSHGVGVETEKGCNLETGSFWK